jgi:predicted house-cleaning NTP pyrophosphatase (Maf/HAM1 superfamily)
VVTAVALVVSDTLQVRQTVVTSRVEMRAVGRDELIAYVATGEPLDKAGGYAVQGGARSFVTRIHGSETNVIGLPLDETLDLLAEAAQRLGDAVDLFGGSLNPLDETVGPLDENGGPLDETCETGSGSSD